MLHREGMSMLRRLMIVLLAALVMGAQAQRLSSLAPAPDWGRLEAYQETMTRAEFVRLLETVYAPHGTAAGMIDVREKDVVIFKTLTPPETFTLRFAEEGAVAKPPPRTWRTRAELPAPPADRPLAGLRLALDPGHIGGEWGPMEERSFAFPGDAPVQEGDLTLRVAQLVAEQARALGADVQMVRSEAAPASVLTVDDLRPAARKELELLGVAEPRENYDDLPDTEKVHTVKWHAEKLFYRIAEIHERARRVNEQIKPDLVVCLHFNADDWHDPAAPVFTSRNDLHVIIHGCYAADELRYDDQRFEMLHKLLSRTHAEELAAAEPMAAAFSQATGLPAFTYLTHNAVGAGTNGFVWARNLLANRLFDCPVVYFEPYRMNNEEIYTRIEAGDYEGELDIEGKMRPSLMREYAQAVIAGLRSYYGTR